MAFRRNTKATEGVKQSSALAYTSKTRATDDEANGYDSMVENGTSESSDESEGSDPATKHSEATVSNKRKTASIKEQTKKPKVEKVKQPSLMEINELKETHNLFHSNLFRLQVKEMLSEIRIKSKYSRYIDTWLEQFKMFALSLETNIDAETSGIKVPFVLEQLVVKKQRHFKFQFIKPKTEPYLIGAAATQTVLGPKLVADVCIEMPAECFQKEDYLNLQYELKRAHYLKYIAAGLLRSQHFPELKAQHLSFNYYANNPNKSVLIISSADKATTKVEVRLFAVTEIATFKLSRFVPWNSNIRGNIFNEDGNNDDESAPLATPNYNAGVLFDLTMQRNQQLLNEVFETNNNFQDGLLMLKVWLQQRQLNVGFSGFNSHILAMFMAYLYKQRKLHTNMSSYQVARTVWNNLANSAWEEVNKGISLCTQEKVHASQPTLEQFHVYYNVVFADVTGYLNLCANLSVEVFRRVRMEAQIALNLLNDMKLNSFQMIFMIKYPLYTQFDHNLKFSKKDTVEQILDLHVSPADKVNFPGHIYPQLFKTVTSLLTRGLGKRVAAILPLEIGTNVWAVKDKPPCYTAGLHLGLILNAEHAFEVLDKGPESIADGAEEFRKFWGDKAQLRRFQDGSITESVVWGTAKDTFATKRLVVRSIVQHLLLHHFQLEHSDFDYIAEELDKVYKLTPGFKLDALPAKYHITPGMDAETLSLKVIHVFDELARNLHSLKNLPLEIVGIMTTSPVFRYCDPVPALPRARVIDNNFYAPSVHHAVIQLSHSGKWPGELTALRALKTAFYIQIAKLLRSEFSLQVRVTYDGIMVLKNGYCFSYELAHPKEVMLLKQEKTERGITQYVDCAASIALEKRHYILPKVTGALHALQQLHPSFGGTVMIAKRWLNAQLIDNGLWPDECTELLIASQYLKISKQQITCSPQTGFIRFLHLLTNVNSKTDLFVINFNNELDEIAISELEQRFNTERNELPPLCIATSYDQKHFGKLWSTPLAPSVHVLARVSLLARHALDAIESALLSTTQPVYATPWRIFSPNIKGYDLYIDLKQQHIMSLPFQSFNTTLNAHTKYNWRLPLAGTNFLKHAVALLREAYSDYAVFFFNSFGGREIVLIWKPDVFAMRQFEVNAINGCALIDADNKQVQCKKETLIEDFKFILKDYYEEISTSGAILNRKFKSNMVKIKTKKIGFGVRKDKLQSKGDKNACKINKTQKKTFVKRETQSFARTKQKGQARLLAKNK